MPGLIPRIPERIGKVSEEHNLNIKIFETNHPTKPLTTEDQKRTRRNIIEGIITRTGQLYQERIDPAKAEAAAKFSNGRIINALRHRLEDRIERILKEQISTDNLQLYSKNETIEKISIDLATKLHTFPRTENLYEKWANIATNASMFDMFGFGIPFQLLEVNYATNAKLDTPNYNKNKPEIIDAITEILSSVENNRLQALHSVQTALLINKGTVAAGEDEGKPLPKLKVENLAEILSYNSPAATGKLSEQSNPVWKKFLSKESTQQEPDNSNPGKIR